MSLIFDKISESFSNELPFACSRKPNKSNIKGYFCDSTEINYLNTFREGGFVFSPFDTMETSIVFHEKNSQILNENFIKQEIESSTGELTIVSSNRKKHLQLIKNGVDEIGKGSIKKIVLSRKESVKVSNFDLCATFKRLLSNYNNAFVYVWYHPKVGLWMGATPERLVSLKGNEFTTMALASTQLYKGDLNPEWGSKEKKEHQYVVDYIVSQIKNQNNGIVLNQFEVSDTYTAKAGNLLHLKADIKGVIGDFELRNLLKTLHPTPAVCGLPKEASKKFIIEQENYDRLYYTGFLGEINVNQKTDLYVNLRCVEFHENVANIYVGGGITAESDPEKEWIETVSKTETIKKIL